MKKLFLSYYFFQKPIYYNKQIFIWGGLMKKMISYCICVFSIIIITVLSLNFFKDSSSNIDFLNSFGWEVEKEEIEIEEIIIPQVFDEVYNNYNLLQKQAGLDLENYKGKKAIRYTYLVLNYPKEVNEDVRANVICVKGVPVAGDIMTVSLEGFMHSLNYPKQDETYP